MSEKLKSSYELAMERLRKQDRDQGLTDHKPLTDAQKRRIAELRLEAEAKRAELRILREQRLAEAGGDPTKLAEQEAHYETDLRRVDSWLESKLAEARHD